MVALLHGGTTQLFGQVAHHTQQPGMLFHSENVTGIPHVIHFIKHKFLITTCISLETSELLHCHTVLLNKSKGLTQDTSIKNHYCSSLLFLSAESVAPFV